MGFVDDRRKISARSQIDKSEIEGEGENPGSGREILLTLKCTGEV